MSGDDIIIRDARPADAADVVRFNQAMAGETEGRALAGAVVGPGVARVFDDPALGFYLVAEHAGRPIGCLLVTFEWSDWRDGLFWWIQSVYVAEAHRRRGVYRKLYAEVKARARRAGGVCGLRLYVERDNARARRTYERLGMEDSGYVVYEEPLADGTGVTGAR